MAAFEGKPPAGPQVRKAFLTGHLNLSGNSLTVIPPEIFRFTKLESLDLSSNQLTEIPPEIRQLTKLEMLDLSSNQLTEIPAEIGQLTNLHTLRLGGNHLNAIPPEIGQLTKLQVLNLDGSRLTRMPPEIGQLTSLSIFDLSGNRLIVIPPEIGQLTSLFNLDLSGNKLTSLPAELGYLNDKLSLGLRGNPLREPLPQLIARGTRALATYLRSLKDAIAQYEAKVLLVGEGNVGKTSLVAALLNIPFVKGRSTTHGIEVNLLTIPHPVLDDVEITARTWDFGGQEVYRISHQFFFTRRALYLVVWNAREGQEQNEVEGWLSRIRLRVASDARILVVATHCDERRPELDYPHLRQKFSELLVGQYEVDNQTGRGIPELRRGIAEEAAQLPQMGQLISPRWIAARKEILDRANTEPQISYKQFSEICERNEVGEAEIITLAELMHDLGQIIYYSNDEGLREFVVLDPEWITKAISYVLEDEPTRQADGILDHARLSEIWQDRHEQKYPSRYHPYFLRLMEKFDISYRLQDDEYRSLVAQLVRHDRPELPWDTNTPQFDGMRRLALICQLSESVPGVIAWLTVRHHRASTGRHWRTGVFLRHPIADYASEALLELTAPDQLVIDVRAPSPDLFFNVLRDSVEDLITHRWPGLGYDLYVPCPTRMADGRNCHGKFPLKFLLGYRENGANRAPCYECHIDLDLSQLLTGFSQPELRLQTELQRLNDRVAEVGSGVNRLEGGINRLEGYAAETADYMRRVLQAIGNEITDCPRLFTLTGESPVGLRRLKFHTQHYKLVLWCEHPGHWHPWEAASYAIDQPRNWLIQISPYLTLIFRALQVVVPVAASGVEVVLTGKELEFAQHQLELMNTLVERLPDLTEEDQREVTAGIPADQISLAEGQAARSLRILVFSVDHRRAFGDLRRVQSPSGDFLWVCANHYGEYDPGLPRIPER